MTVTWDLAPAAQDLNVFKTRHTQGAPTSLSGYPTDSYPFNTSVAPARHSWVNSTVISPTGKAFRIVMPPSGGVTSRYMFTHNVPNMQIANTGVTDVWWGVVWRVGTDLIASQITGGSGGFCTIAGPSSRFNSTSANGPYGDIGGTSEHGQPVYYDTAVNSTGGVGTVVSASLRDLGRLEPLGVWEYWVIHTGWSRTSGGFREIWRNGVSVYRYDGFTVTSTPFTSTTVASIEHRLGWYRGGNFTTTGTVDFAWMKRGTTRAEVDPGYDPGGAVIPPTITLLRDFDETFTVDANKFVTRQGSPTVSGGLMQLSIPTGTALANAMTDPTLDVTSDSVIFSDIIWPARVSNTTASSWLNYFTVDFGAGDRAVLRRRYVASAAGAVTSDQFELVIREGNVDPSPTGATRVDVTGGLASTNAVKIAFNADNLTVSFQYSTDNGVTFTELGTRAFSSTTIINKTASLVMTLQRESGDVLTATSSVSRVQGSSVLTPTGTPPTPVASVPQPPAPSAAGAIITSGTNPATGQVTLTVAPTTASGSYTPNSSPYAIYESVDGESWAQTGLWQAAVTFNLTGLSLDTTHYYAARYRSNAATPLLGDLSGPVVVQIDAIAPALTVVDYLSLQRTSGQIVASWDVPPAAEGVTSYKAWIVSGGGVVDYGAAPAWAGAGTVASGRVSAPAFTGLSDLVAYRVGVKAVR